MVATDAILGVITLPRSVVRSPNSIDRSDNLDVIPPPATGKFFLNFGSFMIWGLQIALLLSGIFSIVTGRFSVGRGRRVVGAEARLLGLVCLLPIPSIFGVGFVLGLVSHILFNRPPELWLAVIIEFLITFAFLLGVIFTASRFAGAQTDEP